MTALTVREVGPLALLEDRGRRGLAHLGVGRSGAADRASYDLANRLVGNQPGAAAIETTLGGLGFSLDASALVAVTGAPVEIRNGNRGEAVNTSFRVRAGEPVRLGRPRAGLRSYVAVRGGLHGADVLGSVSWDTLARLGTPPLQSGDVLDVGGAEEAEPVTDVAPVSPVAADPLDLPLLLGPRDDWFTEEALDRLSTAAFMVTTDTDRVGARLDGPVLTRRRHDELASEGVVLGALQVPPKGRPTLFLADHPVTGGYPVIGVVPTRALDRASQAAPGTTIRFRPR